MVRNIPSFVFCYKFYVIILIIKAKFLVGENKFMCGCCKIIWNLKPKCNNHIQVHLKITYR